MFAVSGCNESDGGVGQVELSLYDQRVSCDLERETCAAPGGGAAAPQTARTRGFVSDAASRYAPAGLYIYFEVIRPGGAVAHVELDLPAGTGIGGPPGGPFLSYVEYAAGRVVFRSRRVSGRVQVEGTEGCDCRDGRLELLFSDPGPDGQLGTDDDRHRRLSRGRFARGQGAFCRAARLLDLPDGAVVVDVPPDCPAPTQPPSSGGASSGGAGGGGGCYAEDDGYYEEDTGCGYDEGGYDGEYDDTGCGGETSDSEYSGYSDDTGCDGDTSSDSYDSYDSTGCEGDTSSSDSYDAASCEGDAYAAARDSDPRRRRRSKLAGMVPFALLGLLWVHLRRRR